MLVLLTKKSLSGQAKRQLLNYRQFCSFKCKHQYGGRVLLCVEVKWRFVKEMCCVNCEAKLLFGIRGNLCTFLEKVVKTHKISSCCKAEIL